MPGDYFSIANNNVVSLSDVRRKIEIERRMQAEAPPAVSACAKDTVFFVTGGRFECMVNGTIGILDAGGFLRVPDGAAFGFEDVGAAAGAMLSYRFPSSVQAGMLREIAAALPPFGRIFPRKGTHAYARLAAIAWRWGFKLDSEAA